ncbi:MAG: BLUF domain-containing protein [Caldimonas sp.]
MTDRDRPEEKEPLFSLLYVSESATPSAQLVAEICAQSQANNQRDGITGLLVFDGHAFCQYVEGSASAVASLLGRLERDPRHLRMQLLQHGTAPGGRRFPNWRLGYSFSADAETIQRLAGTRDGAALSAFNRWVPALVEPSVNA